MSETGNTGAVDGAAQRLRAARERAGLSQRDAAVQLGVHYGSLNRYEQGRMRVPADLLMRAESLWADPSPAHSDGAEQGDLARDPDEDLPGYWIGFLKGVRRMMGRAMADMDRARADVQQVSDDLGDMVTKGRRWEAATVRMAEARAAEERAFLVAARDASAKPPERDVETPEGRAAARALSALSDASGGTPESPETDTPTAPPVAAGRGRRGS